MTKATKQLRGYLRKPKKQAQKSSVSWSLLYKQACARAASLGDLRLKTLQHHKDHPERALRMLSITSQVDLEREFPGGT
jgi:membrane-bound lytic murein transglycosylase MltF